MFTRSPSRWLILLLLIGFSSLLLLSNTQQPASSIRFGVASSALNLDPRYATDAMSVRLNRLFYQRLVNLDDNGMPTAGVADWSELSPRYYRFRLNAAAGTFPDGHELNAFDVVATYNYVLNPENVSPHRSAIDLIESVVAIDEQTLDFHLSRPDPLFPAYLELDILPAEFLLKQHSFEQMPFGSGQFIYLGRPDPGRLQIQRRSDGQQFEIIEVRNPTVRVLKLMRGEIDLLQNDLSPELLGYLSGHAEFRVSRHPGSNFSYIGFNLQDKSVGDLRVRQAIAHAIDRESIIEKVMRGAAREAETLFPPEHWAGHPGLAAYAYDPARSRKLLQEAGYGADSPLTLVYKTSSDPFRIRLATIIQSQLSDVGIRVNVRSYDWGTFFGDIKAGNFQLYSLSWVGIQTPDIFRYIFASDALPPAGANRGRYVSQAIDELLAQAAQAGTLAEQAAIYRQVEERLHLDMPYVPLWFEDQYAVAGNRVDGYRVSADGSYDGLNKMSLIDTMEAAHGEASVAH